MFSSIDLSVNSGINFNTYSAMSVSSNTYGPFIGLRRAFFGKRLPISLTYSRSISLTEISTQKPTCTGLAYRTSTKKTIPCSLAKALWAG
ncbi:MAG: hypothetical protein HC896_01700 [Bacteroidales bacterium]|nr:hypothetical protein [Bacteroidales bacterium]